MKIRIAIAVCFSLVLGFTSCINDNSTSVIQDTPHLSIPGSNAPSMPIVNFNLGDPCIINPDITYQGGNESELQYEWSVGTYQNGVKGELEVISHDRKLEYKFLVGGTYYAHLNVTDGKVGLSMNYQVNINRTFENGYILVSNDEAGKGNLAFVKIMTAEELEAGVDQIYMEHCIERMNEGVTVGKVLNAVHGVLTWPSKIHRIQVSSEDRCFFLEPNTFTIIAELKYEDVYPGFKATKFMPDNSYPYVYDAAQGKNVHLNLQYMFAFEYSPYLGKVFDDYFVYTYDYYGSPSFTPLWIKYSTSEVFDYNPNLVTFGSTKDLLKEEDILTAFIGTPAANSAVILTRLKADANTFVMHTIKSISYIDYYGPSGLTRNEFVVDDNTAIPARGTKIVASPTYNRQFYSIDNQIYTLLPVNPNPLPKKSEWAIRYGANEVVTFLDVNIETEELYVATYDQSKKRGSFYIYDTKDVKVDNQGKITPKAAHKDCADKITSILYKPSL